jgi:hypothetical protein
MRVIAKSTFNGISRNMRFKGRAKLVRRGGQSKLGQSAEHKGSVPKRGIAATTRGVCIAGNSIAQL